jgi:DNA polymerase III delta prime subunit
MGRLSKSQQKFLLSTISVLIALSVAYLTNQLPELRDLINQLPELQDFQNQALIVIGLLMLLTAITLFVNWKLLRLDDEGSVDKPEEYAVQQNREKLLEQLRKTWISGVLEKSLYHEARVELVLKEVKDQRQETLPPGTRVIQKFDELGQGGTMLILGEPGSGKTTTLLELARDLLERAEQDANAPLPVVLHLAAWKRSDRKKSSWLRFGGSKPEPQKLEDWVLEELKNSPVIKGLTGKGQHYEIDRKVAQYWLDKEQRLVLLLDGLDEVVPEQREGCVAAINEFRQAYSSVEMVVCCRVTDYRKLKAKLEFKQELMIQPLTLQQIEDCLQKTTGNLSAIKNILPDEILQEIANCPFPLWMLSQAYKDESAGRLPSIPPDERIKFLLDLYIYQQLKPPKAYIRYKRGDIRFPKFKNQQEAQLMWIKRLAKNLKKNFYINQIDLLWIIKNSNNKAWHQKTIVAINVLSVLGLAVMLNILFISINKSIPTSGWLLYFSIFTLAALFVVMTDYIFAPFVEPAIKRFVINEKPFELIRAYVLAFWNVLTFNLDELSGGTFKGLFFWVLFPFAYLIKLNYVQNLPHNVLESLLSLGNIVILGLIYMFFLLLIGLAVTFFIRLVSHYLIRALLTYAGLLPWNYHHFLDWTCDRFILQKIGDSYIFIHPMLREHFAQMNIDKFIQWSDTRKVESSR